MGRWGAPQRGGQTEIGGPSLITVELRADFQFAHCARISFGPSRHSPSRLLPSAVSFTIATELPPSGKKSLTRYTLSPAFVSRRGGPNGKLLNGKVGSSPAGRANRNWGPLSDHG